MERYVLSFGSNVGSRMLNIIRAVNILLSRDFKVVGLSNVYLTEPVGPDQPYFLNVCAFFECYVSPREMLDICKWTEKEVGRRERFRWGPREIDVDIIWWSGGRYFDDSLEVPHRHWRQRRFVVQCLVDLGFKGIEGSSCEKLLNRLNHQWIKPCHCATYHLHCFCEKL